VKHFPAVNRIEAKTDKMEPNSNYYELFKITSGIPDAAVWDYGYSYLVLKCCNDMGFDPSPVLQTHKTSSIIKEEGCAGTESASLKFCVSLYAVSCSMRR
jgi:hypothetical protein